jgi:hypothetical protein
MSTSESVTENSATTVTTELRFEDKPRPLVYVGASAYEWKAECHFFDSMVNAMSLCRSQIIRDWGVGDAAIGRKRNYQAWRFLTQTKAEYLFFIDSDIVFEPVHFDRIVAHGLPVVGGIYFKKSHKLEPCIEGKIGEEDPKTHLLEVKSTGTGFLCIRRDVFEKVREMMLKEDPDNFCYEGDPDPETRWDFFPFGARKRSYRSEDWYFCDLARRAGFKVYVDCSVQLGHVGKTIFPIMRMAHEDVADLLFHKYNRPLDEIKKWLAESPDPAVFKEEK